MTRPIAVVCEAPPDQEIACVLADRVLCAEVAWLDPEGITYHRVWRGLTESDPYLLWMDVSDQAKEVGIRPHGHFNHQPGAAHAQVVWKALALLNRPQFKPEAILLVHDDDGKTERQQGFQQARDEAQLDIPIVIGLAHTKRECWVLAGFDPRMQAGELTAKAKHHKRSAKRVLSFLTGDDREREAECWLRSDLGILSTRGERTGLADYLKEVRERLVPLFTGERRPEGGR